MRLLHYPETSNFLLADRSSAFQPALKAARILPHRIAMVLLLADVLAWLVGGILPALLYSDIAPPELKHYSSAVFFGLLIYLCTAQSLDVYSTKKIFKGTHTIALPLAAVLFAFMILGFSAIATKTTAEYSRFWFFSWMVLSLGLTLVGRATILAAIDAKLSSGACLQRALIVTCGQSTLTCDQLAFMTRNRVRAIGAISAKDLTSVPDLTPYLHMLAPDLVILSLPWAQIDHALSNLKALTYHAVEVLVLPQIGSDLQKVLRVREFASQPLLQIAAPPLSSWNTVLKRIEDLSVASLALVITAPILLLTALAIKLESRGPILFKQIRAGYNGTLIEVYKFRSMYTETTDIHASQQTGKNDSRVTRVGRFIRRTSIDELPQFWNVLQGRMSVVGPRPHALATSAEGKKLDTIVEGYAARHRVKPGMTGWAQINGARGELRSCDQVRQRVSYDLHYIENWSLMLDLKIILMTAIRMVQDPHAY